MTPWLPVVDPNPGEEDRLDPRRTCEHDEHRDAAVPVRMARLAAGHNGEEGSASRGGQVGRRGQGSAETGPAGVGSGIERSSGNRKEEQA
jgi:hypothetical protein